ncbi:MAG UNVERIFIED_CONTAM: hypothetical protein LVR29_28290, partial [Microcystis novacekii LVE1205-3]
SNRNFTSFSYVLLEVCPNLKKKDTTLITLEAAAGTIGNIWAVEQGTDQTINTCANDRFVWVS